jgi:hypothetical protein
MFTPSPENMQQVKIAPGCVDFDQADPTRCQIELPEVALRD